MLKLRFAPFAAIGLTAAIAFAQDSAPPAESKPATVKVASAARAGASGAAPAKHASIHQISKPIVKATPVTKATPVAKPASIVKATPVPVATPVPKKQGFWSRVFGNKPTPTPVPATPKPVPIKKKITKKIRSSKPKIATMPPDTTPDRNKAESSKPTGEVTPPTKSEPVVKPPTIKSGKTKGGEKVQNFPPSTDNAEAEAAEKQKYDQAKAKAVADPKVQELRGKADLAATEDESRKALRAYNKAMFKRMKEIDPSIKEHVDRMEAAVMSRLGE